MMNLSLSIALLLNHAIIAFPKYIPSTIGTSPLSAASKNVLNGRGNAKSSWEAKK
jgi:hypothetical protein